MMNQGTYSKYIDFEPLYGENKFVNQQHYLAMLEHIWPSLTIFGTVWSHPSSFDLNRHHLTSFNIITNFSTFFRKIGISMKIWFYLAPFYTLIIIWHCLTSVDIIPQIQGSKNATAHTLGTWRHPLWYVEIRITNYFFLAQY